jgi:hypothetical protein
MKHPAFQNSPRSIFFFGICLLVGLAVFVSLIGLAQVQVSYLVLDGLFLSLLFGVLFVLLWYVVSFADLAGINNLQKIINYSALVVLTVILWLGVDCLFVYISFGGSAFQSFMKCIPMKIVFGIFIFTSVIRFYSKIDSEGDSLEEDSEEDGEKPETKTDKGDGVYGNSVSTIQCIEKITVKVGQKINVIAVADILFLQAEGDYVIINTATGHFIKEQTMKYFEENLTPEKFVRIHRSTIVNINMISRIELYEKQFYRITLQSGQQLKASVSGYRLLKKTLQL